jgi:hypothetical protein
MAFTQMNSHFNMKNRRFIYKPLIILVLLVSAGFSLLAQEKTEEFKPSGKINGMVFADYYYTALADTGIMNINKIRNAALRSPENSNAFKLRRVFLGYEYQFSPKISTLVRFEADEAGLTADGENGLTLKDAFLKWNVFKGSDLFIGLQSTFSFETSERIWGHRFLEKTILDFRGIVSSRDLGLSLRGRFDAKGKFIYGLMVANNSSAKPESDRFKRVYATLGFKPIEGLELAVFADRNFKEKAARLGKDELTTGIFAGFKKEKFAFGIESFVRQSDHGFVKEEASKTLNTFGVSVFGSVNFTNKFGCVGRYDYFDPNTDSKVENDSRNVVIAGLTYKPIPVITISPNIEMETYQDLGDREIDPTLLARITVFWNIK